LYVHVPDMEAGYCLDQEGNGVGLGGGGEAGPSLPERGKGRQLKPSEGKDNMEKDEEQLMLVFLFMSVIAGVLIVTAGFLLSGE
jgi:hypothetical protein